MLAMMGVLAQQQPPSSGSGNPAFLIGMILMMVVFFYVLNAPRRREEKQRQEMLKKLQKNDRVLTRGGVLGTVVGVKGNEITLKVDESTNTKMTLVRAYIDRVLSEDERERIAKGAE